MGCVQSSSSNSEKLNDLITTQEKTASEEKKQDSDEKKQEKPKQDDETAIQVTSHANATEKFLELLNKHQFDGADYNEDLNANNALQLLDIFLNHKCHILTRSIDNGECAVVNNTNVIKHVITIKSTHEKVYYVSKDTATSRNMQTTITMKATVDPWPENDIAWSRKKCVYRHIMQIPIQNYMLQWHDLIIPDCVMDDIVQFLYGCDKKYIKSGLSYPNWEGMNIYDRYMNNEKGDLVLKMEKTVSGAKKSAFFKYMTTNNVIPSFNEKIREYLANNKFYLVKPLDTQEINVPQVKIWFVCVEEEKYKCNLCWFEAVFDGFNNLNMKQEKTSQNSMIKSDKFYIQMKEKYLLFECKVECPFVDKDKLEISLDKFWECLDEKCEACKNYLSKDSIEKKFHEGIGNRFAYDKESGRHIKCGYINEPMKDKIYI